MSMTLDQEKKEIALKGKIRDFVFGIQDGLISTLGLLCGVQSATDNSKTVIITGIAAMFTGALSMATGAFLATKAEKEIFEKELKDQEDYIEEHPYLAHEELLESLNKEGLSRESAYRVVKLFSKQKMVFVRTFQEKVLGMSSSEMSRPFLSALVMYLSFVIGAAVPIIPYFLFNVDQGVWVSVGVSAMTLFSVGVFKSWLARKSLIRGGLEFLLVACGSAFLGWLVGQFLAPEANLA